MKIIVTATRNSVELETLTCGTVFSTGNGTICMLTDAATPSLVYLRCIILESGQSLDFTGGTKVTPLPNAVLMTDWSE